MVRAEVDMFRDVATRIKNDSTPKTKRQRVEQAVGIAGLVGVGLVFGLGIAMANTTTSYAQDCDLDFSAPETLPTLYGSEGEQVLHNFLEDEGISAETLYDDPYECTEEYAQENEIQPERRGFYIPEDAQPLDEASRRMGIDVSYMIDDNGDVRYYSSQWSLRFNGLTLDEFEAAGANAQNVEILLEDGMQQSIVAEQETDETLPIYSDSYDSADEPELLMSSTYEIVNEPELLASSTYEIIEDPTFQTILEEVETAGEQITPEIVDRVEGYATAHGLTVGQIIGAMAAVGFVAVGALKIHTKIQKEKRIMEFYNEMEAKEYDDKCVNILEGVRSYGLKNFVMSKEEKKKLEQQEQVRRYMEQPISEEQKARNEQIRADMKRRLGITGMNK